MSGHRRRHKAPFWAKASACMPDHQENYGIIVRRISTLDNPANVIIARRCSYPYRYCSCIMLASFRSRSRMCRKNIQRRFNQVARLNVSLLRRPAITKNAASFETSDAHRRDCNPYHCIFVTTSLGLLIYHA